MSDFQFYGQLALLFLMFLIVPGTVFWGVWLLFRKQYEENLKLYPDDPKAAFRKTFKEYIVEDLIQGVLAAIVIIPLAIIFIGAFIGYLIFGWRQLLSVLS
jgi:hypothetical protein